MRLRHAPLAACTLALAFLAGCSDAPVPPGSATSPALAGPDRPSIVRLAPSFAPAAYVIFHAPSELPAWLGARQLDLENLLRPLVDRHAETACRRACAQLTSERCPLGPALSEVVSGQRVCRLHPAPGTPDVPEVTAAREAMIDETLARIFAGAKTLVQLQVAWAPGQGAPQRLATRSAGADPAARSAALFIDELLDRGTVAAPAGVPGDWARKPPFDRLRGLEKDVPGLELSFVPPAPGREVTLGIAALRVPEALHLHIEEGKYRLELTYSDPAAREQARSSLGNMTTLAGVARYAEGLYSARTSMLIRWIHNALKGSQATIEGDALVLRGSAKVPPEDWQKAIASARAWMTRKEDGTRDDREDCAEERDQLMLAGEMWQLERGGPPPPDLGRLVDLGMLRAVPQCPTGGTLRLDLTLRPSCTTHGP